MKANIFLFKITTLLLCLLFTLSLSGCIESEEVAVIAEQQFTLEPHCTEQTNPENFGISWDIMSKGKIIDSYTNNNISFGMGYEYSKLEGISTFRGNNYRNSATYGITEIKEEKLNISWKNSIGSLDTWSGCGWTGQPLIVRWDKKTIQLMNLYPEKKVKKDLVEVIYATLDGHIYFYDLDDGSKTRDPLYIGMTFKGTGTIDPRGYPIMYIGSGIENGEKTQRMYIISLIDGKILYEQSGVDSFAYRLWPAFDSSPLIDAKTDTLIWPGENGVLYAFKLNTKYDKETGFTKVDPVVLAKTRYQTAKSKRGYWLGYESSSVIADKHLYISENSGMFFCINIDTMELVWAQDTKDDSNSTPVFQWEDDGNGYIYTAPSLHWTATNNYGSVSIYKLDAETGEILWQKAFNCYTIPGVSGGIQASPLLGKSGTDLENIIIYPIAYSPVRHDGTLVAIDTKSGDTVWQQHMSNYTWSSPVAVYTPSGKSYVVICNSIGNVSLIDGKTGKIISTVNTGANIEASPAIFEDILVIGTRGCKIYGIKLI